MKGPTPEEIAIIERVKRGQPDAFDELMHRYKNTAYCYAYRLTKNQDEASDIVAEAFIRVFRSLPKFKGDSSFSTWLHRIVTNCFLDMRKKANYRRTSLDAIVEGGDERILREPRDSSNDVHERVEMSERIATLEEAMNRIPWHHRMVLTMFHAEGMTYEEIAEALDTPIGTVKSRLNRARCSMRDVLRPYRKLLIGPSSRRPPVAHA